MRFPDWTGAQDCATKVFGSYDTFIGTIADATKRDELISVGLEQAATSAIFQEIRSLSHEFQVGLDTFFYHGPKEVSTLTYRYSLF